MSPFLKDRPKSKQKLLEMVYLQEKTKRLSVLKNRNKTDYNRLLQRLEKTVNLSRESRNRTLIQLGLLLDISEVRETFNIDLGSDLQRDIEHLDKAALLAGFLMEALETLPPTEQKKQEWLEKGTRLFKIRHYQQQKKS